MWDRRDYTIKNNVLIGDVLGNRLNDSLYRNCIIF